MSNPDVAVGAAEATAVFAALGDPTRLAIVGRLNDGAPRSIAQLTEGLGVTRQAVTKHLYVLERAGIVTSRRHGREKHFAYAPEPVDKARDYLASISEHWDEALAGLQRFVEA